MNTMYLAEEVEVSTAEVEVLVEVLGVQGVGQLGEEQGVKSNISIRCKSSVVHLP